MMAMRTISSKEYDLLVDLFAKACVSQRSVSLSPDLLVEELHDGGMGSLKFHHGIAPEENRRLGTTIIEGQFYDYDGTLVSLAVNVDDQGRLYEMDLWKVDFSPTRKFPEPEDMKEIRRVCDS